jgi:foldase protein PrsA
MRSFRRSRHLAIASLFGAVLAVAGCGSGNASDSNAGADVPVPSGEGGRSAAIVNVGERQITKGEFNRAVRARARKLSPLSSVSSGAPLDSPRFERCIQTMREQYRRAGVRPIPKRTAMRRNCKTQYAQLREQVMASLIQQVWTKLQAEESDVSVSAAAIDAAVENYRRGVQGFAGRLKRSGLTMQDVRATVEAQLLTTQLVQKRTQTSTPSERELRAFLRENPGLFGTAASATVDVVVSDTRDNSIQAKSALQGGEDAVNVIPGLGTQRGVRQGRVTVSQGDGQLPPEVEKAVFSARRGDVAGPVEVSSLWYAVSVRSKTAAKAPSFAKIRPQVLAQYMNQRSADAQTALQKTLVKTWRPKTMCAEGYAISSCANPPKAETKTDAEAPSGAAAQ